MNEKRFIEKYIDNNNVSYIEKKFRKFILKKNKKEKYKLKDLALELDCSLQQLMNWFSGSNTPTKSHMEKIYDIIGITPNEWYSNIRIKSNHDVTKLLFDYKHKIIEYDMIIDFYNDFVKDINNLIIKE